jgi:hypothetical protein
MSEQEWVVVDEVAGSGLAEMLRGLLEAQEISVVLSQEGAGHFGYPMTVGRLGSVQILVPGDQYERAKDLLADYYEGRLTLPEDEEVTEGEEQDDDFADDETQGNTD